MRRRNPRVPLVGVREQPARGALSRRTVLRGLMRGAAVAIALPPLEIFLDVNGTAYACEGGVPTRFGLFSWGNGNIPDRWTPATTGAAWELTEQLAPLADVRDLVNVVSGYSGKFPNTEPHTSGATAIYTGGPLVELAGAKTFALPSIDQAVAAAIGGDTIYKSIETAATDCNGQSYSGPAARNPPETDPYVLYARLFGDTFREPGSGAKIDPTLGLRASVLDVVLSDAAALRARVGAADRARLDAHMDGIRQIETRLARLQQDPPALEACVPPGPLTGDFADVEGRPQISARSRAMVDLLTMALACDQVRVFSHVIDDPVGNPLFPGRSDGHHNLTHNESVPQEEVHQIILACVEEFAYLVRSLAAVQEGDGTLLDHALLMAGSEVSEGRLHSVDDLPILLAGSACGALKTGLHVRSFSQDNVSKVLLTAVRAVGVDAPSFGMDEGAVEDTVSELEA